MQNAWGLNQEILINPELYHPCIILLLGHCLAMPQTGSYLLALQETGTLHTTWRYSDLIAE